MPNTFGTLFRLTTFGESHGNRIGGIIDGCPAGIPLNLAAVQHELNRRRPGQSKVVTARKEPDTVVFSSGIFEGKTTGTPIGFHIENTDQKSKDYSHISGHFRPSHADFTYDQKYGNRDHRGGGRTSARETANWVVAGAVAKQVIPQIDIKAYTQSIGNISLEKDYQQLNLTKVATNIVRCPDDAKAEEMIDLVTEIKRCGDTIGGVIACVIKNVPIGLGEPVFDKLHAKLGAAMLSINAVKGFEYGSGFEGTKLQGSAHNDLFNEDGSTQTNHSGGIQGGISNGMDIYFKVAFKPVATLIQKQETLTKAGIIEKTKGRGRHDPCVIPRAVPIVEAMAAMVLTDCMLLAQTNKASSFRNPPA